MSPGMMPSRKSTVLSAGRLLVRIVGRELEALARVDQVADHEADRQGEGGHDHEVDERQAADLADRGGLGDRADAQHDGAEDHRARSSS